MNPNSAAISAQTSTSPLGHHGSSHEINKFYMSSLLNLNQEGMAAVVPEQTGVYNPFHMLKIEILCLKL